jgi:hypothetical protein
MIKIQIVTKFNQKDNQQETLNKGSSETTCKETFIYDNDFLNWFIGFTEAEDSFIIYHKYCIFFEITRNIKYISLLYNIKTFLGFGSVIKSLDYNKKKVCSFVVILNNKHLYILALIFNGNLRSEYRKNQFKEWYKLLELQAIEYVFPKFINNKINVSLSDSWLSGFTDTQGCFQARIEDCKILKLKKQLILVFSLTNEHPEILNDIKLALKLINKICFLEEKTKTYQLLTQDFKKQKILINYFRLYPLKSQKKIEYLRWDHLFNDKCNKLFLTEEGIKIIEKKVKKFKI